MKKADILRPADRFAWNESLLESEGGKICFVCTGNTCRSPMAAAALNHFGKDKGYSAVSAGLSVFSPSGISDNARDALIMRGIAPSEGNRYDLHTSRQVSEEILSGCDRIIGMTDAHAMSLVFNYPQFASKISAMETNIPDPYGGSLDVYLNCLDTIIASLRVMFSL